MWLMATPRYLRFVRALALGGLTAAGCAEATEVEDASVDVADLGDAATDLGPATSPDVPTLDVGQPDVGPRDTGRFIEGPLPPPDFPRSART